MKNKQTIPEQIWIFFSSVKLTVYTLVLLASTSIVGTIVLQNGNPMQYVRLYGEGTANFIFAMGLNDMYHAWWFLLLLVILCINIVVCSVERLSHTWKIIFPRQVKVNPDRFRKTKLTESFSSPEDLASMAGICEKALKRQGGKLIRKDLDKSLILYAEKGRWTRIGVYVVHASILLLLLGALIGAVFGFKANLRLDEGESADSVTAFRTKVPIKLDFAIRCDDFKVKFYDTGAPEEFRSTLTIVENGRDSLSKDILVNHPLRYKGINIFQASYGTASPDSAVFAITDNQTKEQVTHELEAGQAGPLPGGQGSFMFEGFLPHYDFKGHNLGEAFFGRITLGNEAPFTIALPTQFPTFDKMRKGRFTVVVKEFNQRYYTGLQVTKDPGVWYVYAGFILMILGCWVTFFMSHESYYIEIATSEDSRVNVTVAGVTNRNIQGMKLKLRKLAQRLKTQQFKTQRVRKG